MTKNDAIDNDNIDNKDTKAEDSNNDTRDSRDTRDSKEDNRNSRETDEHSQEDTDPYKDRPLKGMLLTTSVGITMVVSILIGLIIGVYLDKYFQSRPWFTITFILLGVVAGFKNLHRTMKEHGF